MADQDEIAQVELCCHSCQVCSMHLIGVIRWVHPLAIAMAAKIQGAHVKVGDEPWCKEIEPMPMRRAAVDAEDRRVARRAVIQIVQSRSVNFDQMTGVRSWLEASLRLLNTFTYIVLTEIC
jgi:hypothetical protein